MHYFFTASLGWLASWRSTKGTERKWEREDIKSMWNTMECKRDSFSGALGGATKTHWERVSHALKPTIWAKEN